MGKRDRKMPAFGPTALAALVASWSGSAAAQSPSAPDSSKNVATVAARSSFESRCAQPGVIKCVGFDNDSDFGTGARGGARGSISGIVPPSGTSDYTRATRDTTVKASGNGALRFTIPPNSPADSAGSYFTNFSNDLSVQFGGGQEFYVQWRQRFSPAFIDTAFAGGGGWKQVIIGTGDQPGRPYASCTALELVVQNTYHRGFPQMYNSCTGSTSHGPYNPFEERFGGSDFKLENARPSPYCLYSQIRASSPRPIDNCFRYVADEWLTFQVGIKLGPRVNDEYVDSYVTLWAAREGMASEPIIEWGPYNLSAGPPGENQRYGKIWLLPYNTGKSASTTNPTAYTWYDELIISRNRIADP
jgi:hypothetical protein